MTKKQEKSPVLNVRKNNSINTVLKANQQHHVESHHQRKQLTTQSPPPTQQQPKQANSNFTVTPDNMSTVSSDDDSDHINVDKLKTIRNKAAQK